ncbi:MAG: glycoside hydrolase family 2 TIM barrel-domain containing protein [Protaetiibacter sp.]
MTTSALPIASQQDGSYPRPQLLRRAWADLSGEWEFTNGRRDAHPGEVRFDRLITVPYPPEAPLARLRRTREGGSGETAPNDYSSLWYRREFDDAELAAAGFGTQGSRVLLHFGAVDWAASVWVNGIGVARHSGGQTPFSADITSALRPGQSNELVVHALDDPGDVSILRGKQDWLERPHSIWYERTSGIWQPVWLEAVAATSIASLAWTSDIAQATVDVEVDVDGPCDDDSWLRVRLERAGELLAEQRTRLLARTQHLSLHLPSQGNGQQYFDQLWRPEAPNLIDAIVELETARSRDEVASYLGLRSIAVEGRHLVLNDRPITVRAVLSQNYWPESHLAAPSAEALRHEVESILALGFNTARVHQKAEDPRFLYWADRLGLMIWGETANAYAFDRRAMTNLVSEWTSLVTRDISHPSIVVWVPLNESWGVEHIAHDPRQQAFSRGISDLTRALDGTRVVMSNDGWQHTTSDLHTVHDYESNPAVLAARYADRAAVEELFEGFRPAGRVISVGAGYTGKPMILSEFGGVSLRTGDAAGWGYSSANTPAEFDERVCTLIRTVANAGGLSGFCYTQLTDTGQEVNGLLTADRTPKIPVEHIRAAVRGEPAGTAAADPPDTP